jgi:hypothetical protein
MNRFAAVAAAAVSLLVLAPAASAKITASSSLVNTANGKVQIAVDLTSSSALTSRTKPKAVAVKLGKKAYKLKRVRLASAAVSAGSWRSSAYGGTAGQKLRAAAGKKVTVKITSRAGTASVRSTLAAPTSGGGTSGPFEAPGRELSGEETRPFLEKYFVNSRFTDCPAGWPNCAVEERYTHCPNGEQRYQRLTPSSGSDINSYGTYFNVNAVVHADGSWAVSYDLQSYGNVTHYDWQTAKDGTTYGLYTGPSGGQQQLGPLVWVKGGC